MSPRKSHNVLGNNYRAVQLPGEAEQLVSCISGTQNTPTLFRLRCTTDRVGLAGRRPSMPLDVSELYHVSHAFFRSVNERELF